MGLFSRWRGPRAVDGVRWRKLEVDRADGEAVGALAEQSCVADGATRVEGDGALIRLFLRLPRSVGVGGFVDKQLVAASVLTTRYSPTILGYVHPAYRGRGLGSAMLDWSLARNSAPEVSVNTTVLTTPTRQLFESRGLHLVAALDRLWLPPVQPVEAAPPPGITIDEWDDADAFDVYEDAFADLPSVPFADAEEPGRSLEDWMEWIGEADEIAVGSLLARDVEGKPVGFVVCQESGPLQVGTVPAWRRRGLGRAMLTAAIARLSAIPDWPYGAELVVNTDNVAAVQLFRSSGFELDVREGHFRIT